MESSGSTPTITTGNQVIWKSTITPSTNKGIGQFSSTGSFDAQGNIMSLLYGDEFNGKTDLTGEDSTFSSLFYKCTKLINAIKLILPTKTLIIKCYSGMFRGCTSLTIAPELPATTLASACYSGMFKGCTSLTKAPELPATTLAIGCYSNMFQGCTSLTTAPELPATTLVGNCYDSMFADCTSLTIAPVLSSTNLNIYCYLAMFSGCTRLTTAPELPATTLADSCYAYMFENCTSLTTAPELPAMTLESTCYECMFYDCTNLSNITMLATDISAPSCLSYWVDGVSSTGTFYKHPDMTTLPTGIHGIPEGWEVRDYQG